MAFSSKLRIVIDLIVAIVGARRITNVSLQQTSWWSSPAIISEWWESGEPLLVHMLPSANHENTRQDAVNWGSQMAEHHNSQYSLGGVLPMISTTAIKKDSLPEKFDFFGNGEPPPRRAGLVFHPDNVTVHIMCPFDMSFPNPGGVTRTRNDLPDDKWVPFPGKGATEALASNTQFVRKWIQTWFTSSHKSHYVMKSPGVLLPTSSEMKVTPSRESWTQLFEYMKDDGVNNEVVITASLREIAAMILLVTGEERRMKRPRDIVRGYLGELGLNRQVPIIEFDVTNREIVRIVTDL